MKSEYDFSRGERGRFFRPNAKLSLPVHDPVLDWAGPDGDLGAHVTEESRSTVEAYAAKPLLVVEHANIEQDTARGGYAHRQLFELVQNGADALSGAVDGGRIAIRLAGGCLYCADDGKPIEKDGVTALMSSHMSPKRGTDEIGRFGLGFKSVLGVTDAPEFFSRAGSFRFDRQRAHERIREVARHEGPSPVLRVADPLDPHEARDADPILGELMDWATNIVRLTLKRGSADDLRQQMRDFPSAFLLFVEHVKLLTIDDGSTFDRTLELERKDEELRLMDGGKTTNWRAFKVIHRLSSDARADRRSLDDGDEVPIWWAAPLDRLTDPGTFWAYFPTKTASLAAGILNAPWKTNEDRQNLLPGPYNDELIDAAAEMIAGSLPDLATRADPARHLDALPRRREPGDSAQSERLRRALLAGLCEREVVPDQDGSLRGVQEVNYPPDELTTDGARGAKALESWSQYRARPANWLHHRGLTRNRLARIAQLLEQWGSANASPFFPWRASVSEWLEALVAGKTGDAAVEASKAALLTALAIPPHLRDPHMLGEIVLMQDGGWRPVDPQRVFLPREATDAESPSKAGELVHAVLARDGEAGHALQELGIKRESVESHFSHLASRLLCMDQPVDVEWCRFWALARDLEVPRAETIIAQQPRWREHVRVRTQTGAWTPIHCALLPDGIVPGPDGRDRDAAIDLEFHKAEAELLERLGAVSGPDGERELSVESWFRSFETESRSRFKARPLPSQPQSHLLSFSSTRGAGPLDVLDALTDDGGAEYTHALLGVDAVYEPWVMRHDTRPDHYPELAVASPAVRALREKGALRTPSGVVPLAEALGARPKNREARDVLLAHPNADRIAKEFGLAEPAPEILGEEDLVPASDVWPGLARILRQPDVLEAVVKALAGRELEGSIEFPAKLDLADVGVVRCERLLVAGEERHCLMYGSNIYLSGSTEGSRELAGVLQLLGLVGVSEDVLLTVSEWVLQLPPPPDVEEQRAAVRELPTDAERLLKAVGELALRQRLPGSLLGVLERDGASLTGVAVAEAAIATHHTGALRHYRHALDHLDPPRQWAGSPRAVDFVRSLGFSAEWAGDRNARRAPYVEVEGPCSLPALHDYQASIVAEMRSMLRSVEGRTEKSIACTPGSNGLVHEGPNGRGRRGMISLPTGAGKTRVAVQAIIEAMRDDGFCGNVLWVADRGELCEQAVEAWRQAWSSFGAPGGRVRISRLWAGQANPRPTEDPQVVVATIQTLRSRLQNRRGGGDGLMEFALVVFDEAHGSIAPTFTAVMQEVGLTRRRGDDEPFLVGLTATPYRGRDEEETARLVRRYGGRRLDAGAFRSDDPEDVVSELQTTRVLALADHQTISGGHYSLSDEELGEMTGEPRPPWLPRSVEDRIARDAVRTKRIIEAYEARVHGANPDWPVLVFATSVEHAQTIAAVLSTRGVPARAVSGTTEASTRRRIVEDFRRGVLKVLVNYGVFREGFDAPRTRVIIVARPVYSPNLYFQMIGRGLRGPRNGGTDRCLIMNVEDNIDNFESKLAFSDLDWLWA